MPHIINTNTGYCETHKQFEYVVLQAGGTGISKSGKLNDKGVTSPLPYVNDKKALKETQNTPPLTIEQFQTKVFEDNENTIYKNPSKSKLKSQPKRILVEKNEVTKY